MSGIEKKTFNGYSNKSALSSWDKVNGLSTG